MIFWSENIQRRPNHHLSDLSKNEDCVDLVLTWLEGIIPLFFFKGVLAFFDFPFASTVALLDLLCCSENSLKSGLFIL